MRHAISSAPYLRVLRLILTNGLDRQARLIQRIFELGLSPFLRFGKDHLATGERMYLRVPFDLNGRVKQIGIFPDHVSHRTD